MAELKTIKKCLVVKALRWFDKINGNTYHSVAVFNGNELIGKENFVYGYGEHYRQTAFEILINAGYYEGTRRANGTYEELNKFQDDLRKGLVFCDDVTRKQKLLIT
jgi:hypothetical protein